MGLGISYGQQSAFNANYGQLINPGSLLSNVSAAKYDVTSPGYSALMALGINPQSGNAANLSSQLLGRLPGMFSGVPRELNRGAKAHAYGVDQLMSMPDLIAFLNASPEERKRIADRTAMDARSMDLTNDAQRKVG